MSPVREKKQQLFGNQPKPETPGLSVGILSPLETLAQSIAGIAPSATPGILVPIVFGFAGDGTWFAYLLGTLGVVFAAKCINEFTSRSVCPGSLYSFVSAEFGRNWGVMTGWSMLFAYILCGAACVTQFAAFAASLSVHILNVQLSLQSVMVVSAFLIGYCTYKDVKLSAKMMLWLEFFSIALIMLLVVSVLGKQGFRIDWPQFEFGRMNLENIRAGVVMAIFSFVGFESAASLGTEAKEPLKSVPRAIMRSVIISGTFFVLTSYAMVASFRNSPVALDKCATPLLSMSEFIGVPALGHILDAGIMMSFFAAACAILNAAARLLYRMSGDGLFHKSLADTHLTNRTPHIAVVACISLCLTIALTLAALKCASVDIVGWLGTLATFGFIYAYFTVSISAARFLRRQNCLTPTKILVISTSALILAFSIIGSLYPVPAAPYNYFPILFIAYMLVGFVINRAPATNH